MIIYRNTKCGFVDDVRDNLIADKIEEAFLRQNISHNNDAESARSWQDLMTYRQNLAQKGYLDTILIRW